MSFLAALNNKLDVPILARLTGAGGAGVFFLGVQLSEMIPGQIGMPLTRALYPGLTALERDLERMRKAFLEGVSALGAVAMPAAFGFAFVATDLTYLLLGEKWSGVAPVIHILAPVIGLQSLFYGVQSYAVALGLTKLVFFRELLFFVVRFPIFLWAALNHGLKGAVIAVAWLGIFHVVLNLAIYARASGRPFWEPLWGARRSFGAIAAMMVYFALARANLAPIVEAPVLLRLGLDVLIGGSIYVASHSLLWIAEGKPDAVEKRILAALSSIRTSLAQR